MVILALFLGLVAVAAAAFGPIVRARVAREAARHHLVVAVSKVRPSWHGVRLVGVRVTLDGVDGVAVRLDEATLPLGQGAVIARGGSVELEGRADVLREALEAWRRKAGASDEHGGATRELRASDLAVRWRGAAPEIDSIEAQKASLQRTGPGWTVGVGELDARGDAGSVHVVDGRAVLARTGTLENAHADAVEIRLDTPEAQEPRPPPVLPRPLVPTPDVAALRARAHLVADRIAARLPTGAEVTIDALSVRAAHGATLGPGTFTLSRAADRVRASFVSKSGAGETPLSAEADLPLGEDAAAALELEGGPVSLETLGLHDGAFGLLDTAHATVAGKGRITLPATDDHLDFDVALTLRDLTLDSRRLAFEPVRAKELGLRARGALGPEGRLAVDDVEAIVGAARLVGGGSLDETPSHVALSLTLAVPDTACATLLGSVPDGLAPSVGGIALDGTFGARLALTFDSRRPDAMHLDDDVRDRCRVVSVPEGLARGRFLRPFPLRVYTPDGHVSEETTGPGTARWVPIGAMSRYLPIAVIFTEDGGFFQKTGFNPVTIRYALMTDLKERRFARGGSTLTMQLAKNLFLSREKTVARKLEEAVLTDYLAQAFTQNERIELYLNVIEFGPNVYGVKAASAYYFGKAPAELGFREALFLASMLPSPNRFFHIRDTGKVPDAWLDSIDHLMRLAEKTGYLSEAELEEELAKSIVFAR